MTIVRNEADKFRKLIVGVIVKPTETLHATTRHPMASWAVGVLVIVGLANGVTGYLYEVPALPSVVPNYLEEVGPGSWVFLGTALQLIGTFFASIVVHLASRVLGGQGTLSGQFAGFGFAHVPWAFNVVALMLAARGAVATAIGSLLGFAVLVWWITLGVIATRENHGFSTGFAVSAMLIGTVLLLLGVALIIGLVSLANGRLAVPIV